MAPNLSGIELTKLAIPDIIKFLNLTAKLELQYKGQSIPLATLISDGVIRELAAIGKDYGWDLHHFMYGHFVTLNNKSVRQPLGLAVRPHDTTDFLNKLKDNSPFSLPEDYVPSVADFEPLYQAYLKFGVTYLQVYDLLTCTGDDHIHITLSNSAGGLYAHFHAPLPSFIAESIFAQLNVDSLRRCKDIKAFVTLYDDGIRKMHKTSQS
jgi:hypothetical protein